VAAVLILSDAEVSELLTMRDSIEALEKSFAASAESTTVNSPWVQLFVDRPGPLPENLKAAGYQLRTTTGYTPTSNVVALRLSSDVLELGYVRGSLRRHQVPAANGKWAGLVMLFSLETGEPLALFPDGYIQGCRVGATNGLGTKYLSRPNACSVGLLGSGGQAESRLRAYQEVRDIELVKVFSPTSERRQMFAEKMSKILNIRVVPVDTPEAAVQDVDIIAAATNSLVPVVEPKWIRPGVHVDCLRELEFSAEVIRRADVAAYNLRSRTAVLTYRTNRFEVASQGTEGGFPEIDIPEAWWKDARLWNKMTKLEDVMIGRHPGRRWAEDVTLFLSRGVGQQFAAVGAVVLERARAAGMGLEIPADRILQDRPS
jgi:ornithine cyclodeaminase/alanine dehydrogenase-like protein (mu-crystallin family)